ncbi:MAG TPA: glutamine--fructose-6-phosphate transaminase (isomerizing) [Syntrophorhabdaceae bacterium]|nr:glutamine--fructose-6-phosphate transaminase (isomerizing) [Syntrophorhabdaceae bacterium]
MCGIVGYEGTREACDILIDALSRLEYRGYDSAGIALLGQGEIRIERRKGKVEELRKVLKGAALKGSIGLAHTRWATHGVPSERNAHPHRAGDVVVVHNGIIENYLELKEHLKGAGHVFISDTDTEVIPHLITDHARKGRDLVDSVRLALKELKGSWAVGILKESERTLVAAKNQSPLIVGVGDGEYFIASDIPAIINMTNRFIFLEDNDMAIFKGRDMRIINVDGEDVVREVRQVCWTAGMAEKGGYSHFMLKEIFEQPQAISDTLLGRAREEEGEVEFEGVDLPDPAGIRKIWMVACGTSHHACMIGKNLIETSLRIPVETDMASEFRYRDPIVSPRDLFIAVSQSGETADTIAAMREARSRGASTLSICNVLGSTLAREAENVVFTHAGPEIGVASTKAFTTQISVMFLLTLCIGKRLGIFGPQDVRERLREIRAIPRKVRSVLDEAPSIQAAAARYMFFRSFLFLGRGINFPTALEGALKLKEISYIHAEAHAAGEMKHGPIALIDDDMPVVCISPADRTYKKACGNMEEVMARKGNIILISDDETHEMAPRAGEMITVPRTAYELQPILSIVPLQLLAYYIADLLGMDVDQPRNLAKSVTVE